MSYDPYNLPDWMSDPTGTPLGDAVRNDPPPQPLAMTLEQAFSGAVQNGTIRPQTIVDTTLRVLGNGHNVFRTLVRMYRREKTLVPEAYRAACAQYDSLPIDKVPLAPPIPFPKLPPRVRPVEAGVPTF